MTSGSVDLKISKREISYIYIFFISVYTFIHFDLSEVSYIIEFQVFMMFSYVCIFDVQFKKQTVMYKK